MIRDGPALAATNARTWTLPRSRNGGPRENTLEGLRTRGSPPQRPGKSFEEGTYKRLNKSARPLGARAPRQKTPSSIIRRGGLPFVRVPKNRTRQFRFLTEDGNPFGFRSVFQRSGEQDPDNSGVHPPPLALRCGEPWTASDGRPGGEAKGGGVRLRFEGDSNQIRQCQARKPKAGRGPVTGRPSTFRCFAHKVKSSTHQPAKRST